MIGISDKLIKAVFYDGKTADEHHVSIFLNKKNIKISFKSHTKDVNWNYEDIESLPRPIKSEGVLFLNKNHKNSQLIVKNYGEAKLIIDKTSYRANLNSNIFKIFVAVIAILLTLAILVKFVSILTVKFLPKKLEKQLGEYVVQDILKDQEVCDNEKSIAALKKVLTQIENNVDSKFDYDITVIKSQSSNAIALPGGNIMIFSKLIDAMESKEELYMVLAHEIGHIEKRHSIIRLITTTINHNIISVITGSDIANYFLRSILDLENSRKEEIEADLFAINTLNKMGIDETAAIRFFERMSKNNKHVEKHLKYISTHPQSKERIEHIKNHSRPYKKRLPLINNKEWKNIRNFCK